MSNSSFNSVRFLARSVLATVAFVLAVAVFSASNASAVKISNPSDVAGGKDFVAAITGGYVQINGMKGTTPVQNTFSLNFGDLVEGQPDPRPKLRGTISSAGALVIPKSQVTFPPITFPVDATHNVNVTFVATNDWVGSIDPLTGKVSLTAKLMIQLSGDAGAAVLDPATCRIGTPSVPVTISASTHVGESIRQIVYQPDPSKGPPTVESPTSYLFPGGRLLGDGYSDELGVWPSAPEPVLVPSPRPAGWAPATTPRPAGSFRVVDDTLAVPASSGCLGGAGDATINDLLGLPAGSPNQRASFDIAFVPGAGREGANAIVQKGVKSNFVATGLSTPGWPSTEVPQLPTQVPLNIDASSSTFAGTPNATERYRFDLGSGTYGAWGLSSTASLPAGFTVLGTKTIRVQAKDSDGDVDTKTRTINVVQSSDISLTKTADTTTFRAGSNGAYTLNVKNNSSTLANSQPVTVTDTLPTGTSVVSASGAGWTCTTTSGSFSCTRPTGTIAAGQTTPIALVVAVAAGAPNGISNTATATQLGDPDHGNDSGTANTSIRKTDLRVQVSHTPADFPANGVSSYTVSVDNLGDGETVGATTVVTTLPAGLTYVPSGSGATGWTCASGAGNAVTCGYAAAIAPSGGASPPPITLRVKADRALSGTVDTDVTVATASDTDAFGGSNHVVEHTSVVTVPDLTVQATHSPSVLVVGSPATFDLKATNESIVDVTGTTTIQTDLPAGLTVDGAATGIGWDCTTSTSTAIRCTTEQTVAHGADATTVHVPVTVGHDAFPGGTLSATVANPSDGVASNDTASDAYTVTRIDLSISKRVDQSNFSVGVPGRYKIAVKNDGSAPTVGAITVVDDLPETVDFDGAAGPGWTCTPPAVDHPRHVSCSRTAVLAPGASAPELVITVNVTDAAAEDGTVTNTATVATARDDAAVEADAPVTGNNASTVSIAAISVDVAVTEVSHGTAFRVGNPGSYSVKVSNVGAIPTAVGAPVTVTVDLPAGVTPGTVSPNRTGWVCADAVDAGAHRVTCVNDPGTGNIALPAKTATSTATFTIPVDVDDSAPAHGDTTATIATLKDANPEKSPNNVRTDAITAINRIDLRLRASETLAPFAGHTGRYLAKLDNVGTASTVDPATVSLTLPDGTGFTPSGSGGAGWNCSASTAGGTAVSCTRTASLVAGAAAADLVIGYTVDATPPAESWTEHFAVTTGGEPATRLANNEADVASQVQVVDLSLKKTHVATDIHAGRNGSAKLVVKNVGNAASSKAITVTDALDATKLDAESASGNGWRCDAPVSNTLSCTYLDSAAAGATLPAITTVFKARSDATGESFDSSPLAIVTSSDDVRHGNDTGDDPTKVIVAADLSVTHQSGGAATVALRGGRPATDTYTVRNVGALDATDVTADVSYTAGIELGAPISASPDWDCALNPGASPIAGHPVHVQCTHDGAIGTDDASSLSLRVQPKASSAGSPQSSAVSVVATDDSNADNDMFARDFAVTAPDLSVSTLSVEAYTATDPTDALMSGKPAVYSSKIENVGNEVTNGPIRATFDLPAGAGFTDAPLTTNYGTDWGCTLAGGKVSCVYGGSALAPGASTTVRIPLTPIADNAPEITPSIAVKTDYDATAANDTRSVTDKVVKPAVVEVPVDTTPTTPTTVTPPPAGSTPVSGRLTTGSIRLGTLPDLAMTANQITVSGSLSSAGAMTLPQANIKFATISVDAGSVVPGATAKIILSAAGDGSGTLPAGGGSASVKLPVTAKVEVYAASGAPLLNLGASSNCTIGPINFDLSGNYDAGSKLGTFANAAVSVPGAGAGCGPIGATLGSAIGIPSSTNAVNLTFQFSATAGSSDPPSDKPSDKPVVTPKEGATKVSSKTSSVSTKGKAPVVVACTSSQTVDSCSAGKVSLKAKVKTKKKKGKKTVTVTKTVTIGSVAYAKLAAGKSATVSVALTKAGKALAKPGKSFKVTTVLQSSAKGAKAVNGSLTLKYPKAKKSTKKKK